jgi:hypothetical protein
MSTRYSGEDCPGPDEDDVEGDEEANEEGDDN